jgi:anti-anti-sigma factor
MTPDDGGSGGERDSGRRSDDGRLRVDVSQVAVVALHGEVDLAGLNDLQDAIEPLLAPGQTVVLDLSEVTFADSTLLKVITHAHGRVTNAGGALLLRNPSDQTRRLLTLGQLDDLVQEEVDRQNDMDVTWPPPR